MIRPPLVYGPGAPGNFAHLMRVLYRGVPLPLGAVYNRRSFVAVENLVSLLDGECRLTRDQPRAMRERHIN